MAIDKFKDVLINGREFRIGLVTADIGNWIIHQITAGNSGDIGVYEKIKRYLLCACSYYQPMPDGSKSPMRILNEEGRWLVPDLDLDYDLDSFYHIYEEALDFNFTPFLKKLVERAESKKDSLKHSQTTSR